MENHEPNHSTDCRPELTNNADDLQVAIDNDANDHQMQQQDLGDDGCKITERLPKLINVSLNNYINVTKDFESSLLTGNTTNNLSETRVEISEVINEVDGKEDQENKDPKKPKRQKISIFKRFKRFFVRKTKHKIQ